MGTDVSPLLLTKNHNIKSDDRASTVNFRYPSFIRERVGTEKHIRVKTSIYDGTLALSALGEL